MYKFISLHAVLRDCLTYIWRGEEKIERRIETSRFISLSLTTGMWTSNQTLGYVSYSTFYNWWLEIIKENLKFFKIEPPHATVGFADTAVMRLLEWKFGTKISTITLDSFLTNDCIASLLKDQLSANGALSLNFFFFFCVCMRAYFKYNCSRWTFEELKMRLLKFPKVVRYI